MQNPKFMTPKDIERLAKTNSKRAFKATLQKQHEIFQAEVEKHLHTAIRTCDYDLVVHALDGGAKPDSRINGWSAMDIATYSRDHVTENERPAYERIIALLVARGATPEKSMEERARELLKAIDEADVGRVRGILRARVNPDTVVEGWTALGRVNHLIETEERKGYGQQRIRMVDSWVDIKVFLEDRGAKNDVRGEPDGAAPEKSMEERARELLKAIDEVDKGKVREVFRMGVDPDTVVEGWTALGRTRHLLSMQNEKSLMQRQSGNVDILLDIIEFLEDRGAKKSLRGDTSSF